MGYFQIALFLTVLFCSLVAGFLFAFAVVVMPGIRGLGDGDYLRAFKVMDRIIQNNQPLFILVWVGSVVALAASTLIGVGQLDGTGRLLMISALVIYLLGVQLPTITINVPLNNKLQSLEIDEMSESAQEAARKGFEPRWTRWNSIRTVLAILTTALLILLLFRL